VAIARDVVQSVKYSCHHEIKGGYLVVRGFRNQGWLSYPYWSSCCGKWLAAWVLSSVDSSMRAGMS
jgi:hypothetical protein